MVEKGYHFARRHAPSAGHVGSPGPGPLRLPSAAPAALRTATDGDPWRTDRRWVAASLHPGARDGDGNLPQHGARRIRTAPRRGLPGRAARLGDVRPSGAARGAAVGKVSDPRGAWRAGDTATPVGAWGADRQQPAHPPSGADRPFRRPAGVHDRAARSGRVPARSLDPTRDPPTAGVVLGLDALQPSGWIRAAPSRDRCTPCHRPRRALYCRAGHRGQRLTAGVGFLRTHAPRP